MNDNDQTSPWESLADELGSQPAPGADQRHQPEPVELPSASVSPDVEPPRAQPGDWNQLADSLGLPPSDPAVHPEPEAQQNLAESPPSPTEVDQQEATSPETPQHESISPTEHKQPLEDLLPLPNEIGEVLEEAIDEIEQHDEDATPVGEESVNRVEEEDPGESSASRKEGDAARTAFDALFSEGSAAWGSAMIDSPSPEENPLGFKPRPHSEFDTEDDQSEESPESTPLESDSEEEEQTTKRKRSRRRRRGGRKKGETAGDAEMEGDGEEDLAEETARRSSRGRRRRRAGSDKPTGDEKTSAPQMESNPDAMDAEVGESGSDSTGKSSSRSRPSHRNLPTWSEAIGVIVDANLQLHAKSPNKSQSSRGRGRGGRRRKKS